MNWWTESKPDEIKAVPWMHPAAVLYLKSLIDVNSIVIEHGCGGSTLWLSKQVKELHSYEHFKEWFDTISAKVAGHENIFVHLRDDPPLFPDIKADLLLVDGFGVQRPDWIRAAHKIVKPGGVVVVDNSERPQYQAALGALTAYTVRPLYITGYTDYGKMVTTSFYRLRGGESWI